MRRHAKASVDLESCHRGLRLHPALLLGLTCVLVLCFGATSAHASRGVVAAFGHEGSGAGEMLLPNGLAVNHTSGDVYIADGGNGRVDVFDSSGNFLRTFGWDVDASNPGTGFEICTAASGDTCQAATPGDAAGQFSQPHGLAIDQSNGAVYVGDVGGNNRVQKFDAEGNFILTFGGGVDQASGGDVCTAASGHACQAGSEGSKDGHFNWSAGSNSGAWLVVDPTTRTVFATDNGDVNRRVSQFSPQGLFLNAFSPPESAGMGGAIAADANSHVYTVGSNAQRYTTEGAFLGLFAPKELIGANARVVTVDPSSQNVLVIRNNPQSPSEWEIAEFDGAGTLVDRFAEGIPEVGFESFSDAMDIYPTSGQLYVSDFAGNRVLVVGNLVNLPTATIAGASAITDDVATLHGVVNPNGGGFNGVSSTRYRFEYRPEGTGPWMSAPATDVDVGAGIADVPVETQIEDLDPNTAYEARLVATRQVAGGRTTSSTAGFTTSTLPPAISLVSASRVTDTTARLGGAIDAENSATSYYFEYGLTTAYGAVAPLAGSGGAGSGLGDVGVFQTVSGLQPDSTYHFRLVATNQAGTEASQDVSFKTRTVAEMAWGARGMELVSSPDNGNQNLSQGYISPDGNNVYWISFAGGPGSTTGHFGGFRATRTTGGWQSTAIAPPAEQQIYGEYGEGYVTHSPDLSTVVLGASPDPNNVIFTHLIRYSLITGQQDLLHVFSENIKFFLPNVEASDDQTHVLVPTRDEIDSNHAPGTYNVYDVGSGTPELVSVMPDGSVPQCGVVEFGGGEVPWVNATDASRAYFISAGSGACGKSEEQLYLRDRNANQTYLVSGPPVTGPEEQATFLSAGNDGHSVMYYTKSALVAADTDASTDFYRWTEGSGNECLTCGEPEISVARATASEDLSHVYFTSESKIFPGDDTPVGGKSFNLYVWSGGSLRHISQIPVEALQIIINPAQDGRIAEFNGAAMSATGDAFAFVSDAPGVTADSLGLCERRNPGEDPTPCTQLYRYDDESGVIECVSCEDPGAPTVRGRSVGGWAMSSDGETIAFKDYSALVPSDVNGSNDVYEWHNGVRRLVSDGVTDYSFDSTVAPEVRSISANGRDIVLGMSGQETGHEIDHTRAVYDARIGGGFPVEAPRARCNEESCQGPLRAPPPLTAPGSQAFNGTGNAATRRKARRGHRRHKKHHRKAQSHAGSRRDGGKRG